MGQLQDWLDDLEDWLDESKGTEGVDNQSGPLSDPNKSYVSTRLADTLSNITHGLSSEHLDVAGTADISGLPSTLPGVADWCHNEAVRCQAIGVSDDFKGSRLKSIRDAIEKDPGGYKDLVGI